MTRTCWRSTRIDAEQRGIRDGDWVALDSRAGETSLARPVSERVQPGVVYTTFHHPDTGANVVTTDYLRLGDQLPGIQGDGRPGPPDQPPLRLAGGDRGVPRARRAGSPPAAE